MVVRHVRNEAFFEVGARGGFRLRHPVELLLKRRLEPGCRRSAPEV
jgi:hypothetical protein